MNDATTLQFLVGTTDDGETVYGNFQKTGHFISSGHVGSGHASYDEGAFVTDLLQNYSSDELQIVMIDPKQVQLTPYEGISYLWRPIALTPEDAKAAVTDLLEEIDRRFELFKEAGVNKISEYNAQTNDKLPFIILLCTEIADLMMVDGKFYGDAFDRIWMLAQAVGIHMYIATQRPSVDVLPAALLGGVLGRLIFAVASATESERLLGEVGAEKITEPGRLIFSESHSSTKMSVKAHYVTDEEVMKIVQSVKGR